ncbi:MAG TPA: hypothetical protein VF998_07845 [Candidatus Limnocylindria bacterium]
MFIVAAALGRVGAAVASVLYRFGALRRVDHGLGVPLGALTAIVTVYVALVALVSFDTFLAPFHGAVTVDTAAVAAVRAAVAANPQFGVLAAPGMLDELAAGATKAAIPADQLGQFDQGLAFYEQDVRPQLLASALAPLLVGAGAHAPIIGRAVAFPAK